MKGDTTMNKLIGITIISVIGYVSSDVSLKTQADSVKGEDVFPPQSLETLIDNSIRMTFSDTIELDTTPYPIGHDTVSLTFNDLIEAVIYIESRGDTLAYNLKEKAVGCLQIRPIMVREVNRVLRKHKTNLKFVLSDRWSRQKSIDMFHIMAEEVKCCEELSQMEFFEIVARRWNGGRRGDKKKATIKYWERIKNQLNIINYGKFSNQ